MRGCVQKVVSEEELLLWYALDGEAPRCQEYSAAGDGGGPQTRRMRRRELDGQLVQVRCQTAREAVEDREWRKATDGRTLATLIGR